METLGDQETTPIKHGNEQRPIVDQALSDCQMVGVTPNPWTHAYRSSEEYTLGLKWWLGLPLLQQPDSPCAAFTKPVDVHGDNLFMLCEEQLLRKTQRHSGSNFQPPVGVRPRVTKEAILPNCTDAQLRPADLLLHSWQDGLPTAADITVSNGWGSNHAQTPTRENWGNILKKKEEPKHSKFSDKCWRGEHTKSSH